MLVIRHVFRQHSYYPKGRRRRVVWLSLWSSSNHFDRLFGYHYPKDGGCCCMTTKTTQEYPFWREKIVEHVPKQLEKEESRMTWSMDWKEWFLPSGYPASVGDDDDDGQQQQQQQHYKRYTVWSQFGNTISSAMMVLSTQSLLVAVGVVSSSNAATSGIVAATWNWIIKDGIGQLGGMWYARRRNHSKPMDAHPKVHRQYASMFMDMATALELLTVHVPSHYFLPCAGIANIWKNMAFLASSSTRAAIHVQCFNRSSNLGDITAKATSQSIASSLLGTALGLTLSSVFGVETSSFALFLCLSSLHQFATYQSLQHLPIPTLPPSRFLHLIQHHYTHNKTLLTPSQLSQHESLLLSLLPVLPTQQQQQQPHALSWLRLGESIQSLEFQQQQQQQQYYMYSSKYVLYRHPKTQQIHLTFFKNVSTKVIMEGFYHAYILHQHHPQSSPSMDDDDYQQHIHDLKQDYFTNFYQQLQQQQDTHNWQIHSLSDILDIPNQHYTLEQLPVSPLNDSSNKNKSPSQHQVVRSINANDEKKKN